jgi:tetratricopeptide (TPR) repeat protein
MALVSEGRSKSAIQILNGGLELDQNNIDFLLQRVDLHLKLQQADEALADYRTVSRLAPDNHREIDGIQQILAADDGSDLHLVLEIPKECRLAELKAAYRRKAKHCMNFVNRALEIFSDPVKTKDSNWDPCHSCWNRNVFSEDEPTRIGGIFRKDFIDAVRPCPPRRIGVIGYQKLQEQKQNDPGKSNIGDLRIQQANPTAGR